MENEQRYLSFIVAGLLLAILMAAMDNTIVATAIGTIVADLGGVDQFVWVTSAYMVTVMAGMPIFGKLSDMYGRKRFFLFGLIVFLIGSALCGLAQSIVQLSIFRAIQGIGGGALMPIAFTIVFDVFPPEKRGKMTGLLGAVFGMSSVLGPLLGAYITDYLSWHWVFYVNVPIGLLSIFFIVRYYKETTPHTKQTIDWFGALTLIVTVVSLMFALELGGKKYDWDSFTIISLFMISAIFLLAFLYVETKAKEPIISFSLFKRRTFAVAQLLAFLYGATFVILTVFIPVFVQAVYGGTAKNAGLILMPMMLGSVAGSSFAGISQTKTSYRNIMFLSVIAYFTGMLLLSFMTPETSRIWLTVYMAIAGFGVGFSFSLLPTASMHNLEPRFRGTANSTNSFFRSLGMTLGITIFGTIQTNTLTSNLKETFGSMPSAHSFDPRALFEAGARAQIPAPILQKIVDALASSITYAFTLALIPIALSFVFIFFMGNEKLEIQKRAKVGK
ncbi:EmrB/QacA subfamily drug resistance transporter [Anoxybacillus kamchatkensis]|uniref:MDR family MFS transporter n=1 Tax=Anoxybacillus ayderensis TaxID=265546 RepID=UPI0015EB812D|nr:MDR family MFS transporter [Anoxybacillus ayderensis]MBA2877989.1 EmrB/QacA subfamily drug resistance transporter [Anoxybacillus ayderensis]